MEVTSGAEEGFIREWTPCSHILNLIPPRIQTGIFSTELSLTCVDAVSEYIALGTNVGLVYWYDRKKGNIQRLRCEASTSPITYVKIVNTVDYMVGAGNAAGQVTVFQIPKEHPENIPDTLKPKVEPKVERYTIGDLHKSKITSIEWSKNGMRLFSGDKSGVIIMTEIDFYMHLCKSMEIVNEEYEIVQMSYHQNTLLVSSLYRTILCERRDARWHVSQLGKKERKSLCRLGAVFQHSYARGGGAAAYCARAGLRLWRADAQGNVLHTLLFKLNPAQKKADAGGGMGESEASLGPLHVFREHFLVAHDERLLYVLDPRSLTAVAVVDDLRRILSVSVNKDEIFVLEGPRSLILKLITDETSNLMTRSLTSSIQQAVNTVRELTQLDTTAPYITSVLEQPISLLTRNETLDSMAVASAEECFELPPIKNLPTDIADNVLESIVNEFKDVSSDAEEIRKVKSEELQKKLSIYNRIMEKKCDEELIHSSKRSRRREAGSGATTPRLCTPARKSPAPAPAPAPTQPATPAPNDDVLEKEIEEKEKILAKLLNLESFSIASHITKTTNGAKEAPEEIEYFKPYEEKPLQSEKHEEKPIKKVVQAKLEPNVIDLVPKVVQLPNNWNLENIQLCLDLKNGVKDVISPDEHLDSEWEVI
ncbi:WD repeat-containing protein CG11141 [Papilio xuthus]|uniref:WD repeat-containing protein CG11141 n=1 Tax=Papilio xuthus TaxID=66420 RepID=A0A194PP67_PAPXU|nr:WD repeat-containing protein CG11141 [Papilio xuthus]